VDNRAASTGPVGNLPVEGVVGLFRGEGHRACGGDERGILPELGAHTVPYALRHAAVHGASSDFAPHDPQGGLS
jgi:hypothetical protein